MTTMIRSKALLSVSVLLALGALAGCSKKTTNPPAAAPSSTAAGALTTDATLAALVPSKLRSAGKVVVATDASYAPNEFFGPDHKTIVGMDVDLGQAIGTVLGINFEFTNTGFDGIIGALGSRFDAGISSFTDNKKREKVVDMVTYFNAGTSFVVKAGSTFKPATLDDLCGHTVAVEKGTTQLDDVTAQAQTCAKSGKGKLTFQAFPDQNGANLAVTSGRDDVVLADSPVNDYAAKQSNGLLEATGTSYGSAPYGMAFPRTADYQGLATAVLGALKKLIASGDYLRILTKWGVQAGAITNPVINGATS